MVVVMVMVVVMMVVVVVVGKVKLGLTVTPALLTPAAAPSCRLHLTLAPPLLRLPTHRPTPNCSSIRAKRIPACSALHQGWRV
eukprot:1157442-Pelagomonas_calceolata.AAC.9